MTKSTLQLIETVLSLNPKCLTMGAGMMATLRRLAAEARYDLLPMRVKVKYDFEAIGMEGVLSTKKTYTVTEFASNQPDFLEKGKIFINGILLESCDYTIL